MWPAIFFVVFVRKIVDSAPMQATDKPAAVPPGEPKAVDAFAIQLDAVVRRFGPVEALSGVTLSIRKGEFFSLLGPSGCGKTTLLRIIAGLDAPDAGTLRITGTNMDAVPAHKRPVNTVFQSYALFPHLSVFDNIAFGLRMRRVSEAEIATRVKRVMALVEIEPLGERRPSQLSGGQKQRVALARAIVNEPQVLLLDEPLGALDSKLRQQLQTELHQLQRRLGITFVYVTHDQDEALTMSDRIAVMNRGRIEQLGVSEELYERPRSRFVAQFLGSCNLIEGVIRPRDTARLCVECGIGLLIVAAGYPGTDARPGDTVTLAIRLEKVVLNPGAATDNCVPARVEESVYAGAETQYVLRAGDHILQARVMNSGAARPKWGPGEVVTVHLPPDGLVMLEN